MLSSTIPFQDTTFSFLGLLLFPLLSLSELELMICGVRLHMKQCTTALLSLPSKHLHLFHIRWSIRSTLESVTSRLELFH